MNTQTKTGQDGATSIPAPDHAAIKSHVELLHTLAKGAGVEGILAFTRIDAKGRTHTERSAIGDVDRMADAIIHWSTHPDLNIYASYAIFRKDLQPRAAGGEADVRAVLALVGDLNSDVGKKAVSLDSLPLRPPYVVETSADNFHAVFPLRHALLPSDAKPIAVALSDAIGGDSGTKDISHLWRIAGTLNWPSAKKLERGRPKTPQLVTIKSAWAGETVDPKILCEAVKGFAKTNKGSASGSSSGTTENSTETFDDLPADLKKLIAAPAYPGEDRSRTAASVIFKLFRRGWSDDAVQALFEEYSNGIGERYARGMTHLREEIERLRQKFDEKAFKDTDPVDLWAKFDPPALPRGLFPQVLEDFAFDQGMALGGDMAGIAVGALAVCAAAIPDKIQLRPKRHDTGWHEEARLWVALVGPVSAMKSPILRTVTRPLRAIDAEMARKNQHAMAEYNKLSKKEKQQRDQPKQSRLMMQDTTIEAAQEILKDSPHGVLCYQDELSGWFGSMDKYSSAKGGWKDRAFWLESYNGGPYSVSRIQRGAVFIENLSVSILGGIQPEPIRKLAEESVDDGLLQRLIPIVLRPAVAGRDEKPSQVVAEYNSLISKLHHINRPMMGGGFLEGGATLQFDDGALAIREELEKKHLELQQCESINRKLAAHIGKYNGLFARLCVVWHCVEHAGHNIPATIIEITARRVKGFLHGFLLRHALAFYAGTLGLSNDHDRLTAVAGYILAHKLVRITNRDVARGDRSMRNLQRRETDAIFEQLDALGWITRTPGPRPSDPPYWIVNPAVHQKFAERAKAEAERRERERATISGLFR